MLSCSPTFGKLDHCPYCSAAGKCSQVQRTHTAYIPDGTADSGEISLPVQLERAPYWRWNNKHYIRSVNCPRSEKA